MDSVGRDAPSGLSAPLLGCVPSAVTSYSPVAQGAHAAAGDHEAAALLRPARGYGGRGVLRYPSVLDTHPSPPLLWRVSPAEDFYQHGSARCLHRLLGWAVHCIIVLL